MKKTLITLLMVFGLCATTNAQDAETTDINPAVLQELRQIREALQQIAGDVAKMREGESQKAALVSNWDDGNSFQSRGPNIQRLAGIKLPDLEDADQVKAYILSIMGASRGQNSWSSQDPQVRMLCKIGSQNVPMLIEVLSLTNGRDDYHIKYAINMLADEESKALILKTLPIHHELVEVVVQHGWEDEAKETLLTELENLWTQVPSEWIMAVVNLNDPATYPLLRNYFINGQNRYWTYKEIKYLPIEDMAGAVAEAWQNSKNGDDCSRQYMALAALPYGHVDALEALINMLGDPGNRWITSKSRPAILQVVDFRGSNAELVEWFSTHRDQLHFDTETKKFVVDE